MAFYHRIQSEQKKTKLISKSAKFAINQKFFYTISTIHLRDKSKPSLERKYSALSNDMGYLLSKNHSRALMEQNWSKTPKKKLLSFTLGGAGQK